MTTTSATRASGVSVSQECIISALNYFHDPLKDRAIENTYRATYSPISAVCPTTTNIEFIIPPSSDYVSPRSSLIDIKFRILNEDGSPLAPDTADARNLITTINCPAYR